MRKILILALCLITTPLLAQRIPTTPRLLPSLMQVENAPCGSFPGTGAGDDPCRLHNPFAVLWDASFATNEDGTPAVVLYSVEIDNVTISTLQETQTPPMSVAIGNHTARVRAETLIGTLSAWSPPLAFTVSTAAEGDPACKTPLGNRAVSIFPTNLQKTGSGGALSRARLDFQLSSPNSPVVYAALRSTLGILTEMKGERLEELAGLWFTVPATPGPYPITVVATNAYGCTTELPTSKSVVVK